MTDKSTEGPTRYARIRPWLLVGVMAILVLGGGSSRVDAPLLAIVRAVVIMLTGAMLLIPGRIDWAAVRMPAMLLALFAALMVVQLIPLPPALWTALPQHAQFAEAARVVGAAQPWRPISLTPDLTLNSLIALAMPAAGLIGVAGLSVRRRDAIVLLWIAVAALSILLGIAQVSGGEDSPFYFYPLTHNGFAVGLLSNRNHQAALLAATLPMLAAWLHAPVRMAWETRWRRGVAIAMGVLIMPVILLAGSRSGLLLAVVGLIGALLIAPRRRGRVRTLDARKRNWLIAIGAAVVIVGFAMVFTGAGRALAFDRLFGGDYEGELRFVNTPMTIRIIADFFPFGTGFGSFDPVFRSYETDAMLRNTYFNHAHNDLLELIMLGGAAVTVLLIALLVWLGRSALAVFRRGQGAAYEVVAARAAVVAIVIFLLASLTDYPLRTPLLATMFALACGVLAAGRRSLATR